MEPSKVGITCQSPLLKRLCSTLNLILQFRARQQTVHLQTILASMQRDALKPRVIVMLILNSVRWRFTFKRAIFSSESNVNRPPIKKRKNRNQHIATVCPGTLSSSSSATDSRGNTRKLWQPLVPYSSN